MAELLEFLVALFHPGFIGWRTLLSVTMGTALGVFVASLGHGGAAFVLSSVAGFSVWVFFNLLGFYWQSQHDGISLRQKIKQKSEERQKRKLPVIPTPNEVHILSADTEKNRFEN